MLFLRHRNIFSGVSIGPFRGHKVAFLIIQMVSAFLLRKSVMYSWTIFKKLLWLKSCLRSRLLQILYKVGFLKNLAKLTEKHVYVSLIFMNHESEKMFEKTFLKHTSNQLLLSLSLETPNFWVFFLSSFLLFIDWSSSSLGLCFCPTCQVITTMQIHYDCSTVCVLNKLPLGFLNQSADIRGRKNGENLLPLN